MKICTTSLLLKNILLHDKKPDIGNGVEPSEQKNCAECSTRWPSTQYFRSNLQVIYQRAPLLTRLMAYGACLLLRSLLRQKGTTRSCSHQAERSSQRV